MTREKKWNKNWIWASAVGIVTMFGLYLRWQGIGYESGDFRSCLSLWMDDLKSGSGLQVLAAYNGDYNMPYVTVLWLLTFLPVEPLVSIKGFSMLFDIVCAAAGGALAAVCAKGGKGEESEKNGGIFTLTYALIFLSPVAILNSGYWGQCDSVYTAFVLLAFLCLVREKFSLCMIFWGCAFAFKLQAVFAFPVLMLYYWKNRKFSFVYFLLIPVTMEMLCLPAIIGGCSPWGTFSVYFSQMKTFPEMYYFYPNFWTFFQNIPYYVFGKMAITGTLVLLLLLALFILRKEARLDAGNLMPNLCCVAMTVLCFLPCMHERYGYMLEMAVIVWAVADKKKWWLPVLLQLITAMTYAPGILGRHLVDARILAACYLLVYGLLVYGRIRELSVREEAVKEKETEKAEVCGHV